MNNLKKDHQIYFCGSMRGTTPNILNYQHIVKRLEEYGTVLTAHVANPQIWAEHERTMNDREIYEQDVNSWNKSNVMVAEITAPSHGVGMELGWASLRENYPVLCLRNADGTFKASALVAGCPRFVVRDYRTTEEADAIIQEFFSQI